MKVYVFTKGYEDDEFPAFEEGIYKNKKKAFAHLLKLNKNIFEEIKEEWEIYESLERYCEKYCINNIPPFEGGYSMYEIEVKE